MHELNLIDKYFTEDKTSHCHLSIQADMSGLSFIIYDSVQKQYVALRKYKFENAQLTDDLLNNIEDIFRNDDLLNLEYKSTNFLHYSQKSTLVPASYFDEKSIQKYFEFNHGKEPDDDLHYNFIEPLNTYNLFALPLLLKKVIIKQFETINFFQQTTPFLWHLLKRSDMSVKGKVFLGLNHAFFDIAVVSNGKLALNNTFQYVNETDLLYFVMYVYKLAGFNVMDVPLVMSGDMSMKQDYFDTLKQYIPNVRYESAAGASLAPGLISISAYRYVNLINIHHCE